MVSRVVVGALAVMAVFIAWGALVSNDTPAQMDSMMTGVAGSGAPQADVIISVMLLIGLGGAIYYMLQFWRR